MPSPLIEVEPIGCTVCQSRQAAPEARGKDYLYATSDQEFQFCRCQGCGHLYLNPRPTIAEIGRIYPPEYPTYTKRFGRSGSLLARLKDKVLLGRFEALAARVPTSMRLLDVGCGDGRFLLALRRRFPAAELTGLDWFFGGTVRDELTSSNIQTITGTIETASVPADKFDVITMNQIIEHLWDVRSAVEQCKRGLKIGGLLAIETPNPDGWDRRFFRTGGWGGYYWPRHLNLFTREHLARIMTECGLEVVASGPLLAPPCWIYSCQFSARRAGLGDWFNKVFSDTSLPLLAAFAAIDRAALLLGAETSNQKMIARRVN